jgi:hypothetical protein
VITPGEAVAFPAPDRRRHYASFVDATTWFIIALVALLLGVVLLVVDRVRARGGDRDRRRWAELRGWEFLENDPVLPSRWRYGTIHQGGPGIARDLISGEVPTPDGPRQGYAFDHEQAGRVSSVVAAVQLKAQLPAAVELRLPSARRPDEEGGLDLLEQVGDRWAFVADAAAVRPLLTERLAAAGDALGEDVEVLWAEDSWVLATAPVGSAPERIQDLLADLAEVAIALELAQDARRHSHQ